jgi:3'-5' exonuclease
MNIDKAKKVVVFDIETASNFKNFSELEKANPKLAQLWSKRCVYLRSRFEENKDFSDSALYDEKAALSAEFSRIVCASFGRFEFDESNKPIITIKSYSSHDEREILEGIHEVFDRFISFKFCGHNIKRFDIPVICKRLIINNFKLPRELQVSGLKPWQMPFIDTCESWSFGAWQEGFTSLDLLSTVLEIETPKGDICGSEVSDVFWNEEGGLGRITKYCEKDVLATAQVFLKLNDLPLVQD